MTNEINGTGNHRYTDEMKMLFEAILLLENEDECSRLFEDLCTVKELFDLSQRLNIALMLKGGTSYHEISEKTGASTATISRVNRCLNYGSGGYNTVLERLSETDAKAQEN